MSRMAMTISGLLRAAGSRKVIVAVYVPWNNPAVFTCAVTWPVAPSGATEPLAGDSVSHGVPSDVVTLLVQFSVLPPELVSVIGSDGVAGSLSRPLKLSVTGATAMLAGGGRARSCRLTSTLRGLSRVAASPLTVIRLVYGPTVKPPPRIAALTDRVVSAR